MAENSRSQRSQDGGTTKDATTAKQVGAAEQAGTGNQTGSSAQAQAGKQAGKSGQSGAKAQGSAGSRKSGASTRKSSAASTAKSGTAKSSASKSSASKSTAAGSRPSAGSQSRKSGAATRKPPAGQSSPRQTQAGENGTVATVDVSLGVLVGTVERVGEFVSPWTDREIAEQRVRDYRGQLEKSLEQASERGADIRVQAGDRLRSFETDRLKALTGRAEKVQREFSRVVENSSAQAQGLVNQVGERIGSLR